jgi:acetyl esterase/lipase
MLRSPIVTVLLLVLLAVAFLPAGHAAASALALLPEFFPNAPARPLEWVTPEPKRSTVELHYDGRTSLADLYDPGTPGTHGAIIIFLGVDQAGRDDPRVVRLGTGLARIGIATLIPESQDLLNSKVDPGEIDELVAAFQYLAGLPNIDPTRVGLGGFCIGAGLALDAAEDPRINDKVALVNSFTGYYDLGSYATSILTHTIQPVPAQPGVSTLPWEPAANATAVLADHLISLDPTPSEVDLLRAAIHDPKAPQPVLSRLSPIGRTIWSALTTKDPAVVASSLKQLPPAAQDLLRRLSPDTHLDQLHAKVFIMHDYEDTTVPYVQSRLLAANLRPGQAESDEFRIFNHVDPTASVSPFIFAEDVGRLGWHMFQLIEILQGAAPVERF